jgi:branched-chain amino acid aminotransferase
MRINCFIDGREVARNRAKISVFDNSLFYADGLFETLLAVDNRVIFLDGHLKRLEKGAQLIGLKLPISFLTLKRWIISAVKRNPAPIKKIRLTITAGKSAFWAGKATKPKVIIIVTEYVLPEQPYRLTVSPFRIIENSPFRNVKTLSFVIEMTSRKRAYRSKYDDAMLVNRAGFVAEATSANIFWVKMGKLYTPPLNAGCLEGMTRRHILTLAKENGIPACERNIRLGDFLKADEIFITSSLKLILPVTAVKADKIFRFKVGKVTIRLQELLKELIFTGG